MTREELTLAKKWVETWKKAGPKLERIREEEVRGANTIAAFKSFEGLALLSLRDHPPEPSSGLVEQQRWFRLFAEKQRIARE